MKITTYPTLALVLLVLSACSGNDDNSEDGTRTFELPDYSVINAPSEEADKAWYVSDFFLKNEQWIPEARIDLETLKLGMYELTQFPYQPATDLQREAADRFVQKALDAAVRNGWFSKEKGLSDGYEKMYGDPVHFVNKDYVFDGDTLNPEKPEVLMYYRTPAGDFLMGVMFIAVGERGPQVAGPLSKWHYHIDRRTCYDRGILPIGRRDEGGVCEEGIPYTRSPEMLHVWFFDHPEGRYATKMGLTPNQLETGVKQIRHLTPEQP